MRAPRFWYRERAGLAATILAPLGALYAATTARRVRRGAGYRAGCPVICVGNLNAGGTGKTPTVIALAMLLSARGLRVAVVSRGHGGRETGPLQVDPARHGPEGVGDEPLLMAAFAPVFVARDRALAVRAAEADGAEVIVMDDGFQNPGVVKDLSLVVVDAAVGFGNGRAIPAGPLRETVAEGLARADAVLALGPPAVQARFVRRWGDTVTVPLLTAALRPLPMGLPLKGLRVVAFAGIGRPAKFFETLRGEGAEILREVALGDHQPLTPALMKRLAGEAKLRGAQLITTEKDAARLPDQFRHLVMALPVRLEFGDMGALDRLLAPVLRAVSPAGDAP